MYYYMLYYSCYSYLLLLFIIFMMIFILFVIYAVVPHHVRHMPSESVRFSRLGSRPARRQRGSLADGPSYLGRISRVSAVYFFPVDWMTAVKDRLQRNWILYSMFRLSD